MNTLLAYIVGFISVILVSLGGQYYTSKNVKTPWYDCIRLSITPPGFVFPIVWTILYIFIAISIARTLLHIPLNVPLNSQLNMTIIGLFIFNLTLNVTWCYAFFYKKTLKLAFVNILLLVLSTAAIIYLTNDKVTKYLLTPYLLWLSFASLLNLLAMIKKC